MTINRYTGVSRFSASQGGYPYSLSDLWVKCLRINPRASEGHCRRVPGTHQGHDPISQNGNFAIFDGVCKKRGRARTPLDREFDLYVPERYPLLSPVTASKDGLTRHRVIDE